jgi:hypothetical protein
MPQPTQIAKATLTEIMKDENQSVTMGEHALTVQFNPQTLKVTYSNRTSGGAEGKAPGAQGFGRNSTRLSMELWFDVTAEPGINGGMDLGGPASNIGGTPNDVRGLTGALSYFMRLKSQPPKNDTPTPPVQPQVRFQWGTFLFDGLMESMDETLEYFSADGRPLRASVSLGLSKDEIDVTPVPTGGIGLGLSLGAKPLFQASAGVSLQQAAARAGLADWKGIARGNGIENPRLLAPGALLDLSVRAPALSAGVSLSASLGGSARGTTLTRGRA